MAATNPTLPQLSVDTTYSLPTGTVRVCTSSAQFSAALTAAVPGDVIQLQAGTVFTGPFTLPAKSNPTNKWIYIVSSALASLPAAGTRVSSSHASLMPKLSCGNTDGSTGLHIITNANGANYYRFVGIEFVPLAGAQLYYGTNFDGYCNHIILDRCYGHGLDANYGPIHMFHIGGNYMAVVDSYVNNVKNYKSSSFSSSDTQAVTAWNGSGPYKIYNNFLEAGDENIMFGGASAASTDYVPADITIQKNYLFKRLAWVGTTVNIKNLIEFKMARRILVEGNYCENSWMGQSDQLGFGFVITVRNQSGDNLFAEVVDLTARYNWFKQSEGGINILTTDTDYVSQPCKRVKIHDNVFDMGHPPGATGDGCRALQLVGPPLAEDIQIVHNTMLNNLGVCGALSGTQNNTDDIEWNNNIFDAGNYGIMDFDGFGLQGYNALNYYAINCTLSNNVFYDSANLGSTANYPGNFFQSSVSGIGFVDYAGKDFTLSASSPYRNAGTDGLDLGANIALLNTALAGVLTGTPSGGTSPTASFTASVSSGQSPLSVTFSNTSTGDPTPTYAWDFDLSAANASTPDTSTQTSPTVTYDQGGSFTAQLTATNANGTNVATTTIGPVRYLKPTNFGAN